MGEALWLSLTKVIHKKRLAAGRLKMEFLQVWRLAGVASLSGHCANDIGNSHRFVYCFGDFKAL